MVLSSEFEERLRNTGGVLDLSGLALNSNASQLADVLISKPVTHLVLADCMLDQSTADRLLESLSGLVSLDLRGNDLRGRSVSILAAVVRKCSALHSLHLEWNALGQCDQQFDELCNAIATNRTLARLDLRNNQLGNSHGVQLAQLLATNPMLRVLDLRWNRIGSTGGREIVEALKHNSTIEELLLEGNGLSRELIDAISIICERNMLNHQNQSRNQQEASFLLAQIEDAKTFALGETIKMENQLEKSRREKVQLESTLWGNKEILVELRSNLEIAEAKIIEKEALIANLEDEMKIYKQESREIATKLQLEIDSVKAQKDFQNKSALEEAEQLRVKISALEAELEMAKRDIKSFKAEIDNSNKNIESERRNFHDTRENEEMHYQRNINRLNEAVERERNAKQQKEDENLKLREELARQTRLQQEEENKNSFMRREFERDLKQKKDEELHEMSKRVDAERKLRAEAERNLLLKQTCLEDTQMRLTSTEESRDRITNQFRALEISIEPTKTQLENITRENLSLKEKHMVESNDLRTQISSLRDQLSNANSRLQDYESRQKQRDETLRLALTQYFQ